MSVRDENTRKGLWSANNGGRREEGKGSDTGKNEGRPLRYV